MLERVVVLARWCLREASEEGDGVADIEATDHVRVDKLTQNLTIAEADVLLEFLVLWSSFSRALKQSEGANGRGRDRDHVVAIRLVSTGGGPAMSLKDAIDVGLAGQLDVVTRLKDVNAVVPRSKTLGLGGDVGVDEGDELFGGSAVLGANTEVVDLTANQNELAVDGTTIEVALVGGRSKAKSSAEDVNDVALPKVASFRMTLNCATDWNNVCTTINGAAELL